VENLRAALFDLDGTLARTHIDFDGMRRAMHALSERRGTSGATQGEHDILEIVAKMARAGGDPSRGDPSRGDPSRGDALRREAWAVLEAMEVTGCADAEPIEGASELLRRLRHERGLPIAVITRNCRRVSQDLLSRFDLAHDLLLARDDVSRAKPHPDAVLDACRVFGVPPGQAVLVGDLWTDIAAGRAAGALTVGIQWPHDPPHRFARCAPDYEVASLGEAAALLLPG
jgi:HAD superfamily hydrolase (TIGR01509 family)